MIPRIQTPRLTLRGHQASDFDPYAAFWAGSRSKAVGGPFDRKDAWEEFLSDAGHWVVRGFGSWIAEDRDSGQPVGWIGFYFPDRYEEVELGWTLFDQFEGKGYAQEAAIAALEFGAKEFDIHRPASFIEAKNTRSIALAERLGAIREDTRDRGNGPFHVYRHPEVVQ